MNEMPRLKVSKKKLVSYILPSVLCIVYGLFIDIRFGTLFFAMYLILPFLSAVLYRPVLGNISLDIAVSAQELKKSDNVQMDLKLQCASKHGFCLVKMEFYNPLGLVSEKDTEAYAVFALSKNDGEHVIRSYSAVTCGRKSMGIRRLEVTDLFGLCRYSFPEEELAKHIKNIRVLPDIPEMSGGDLLKEALDTTVSDDDDEENEIRDIPIGGLPGFEHREYVPGDSFKKINWKLSAKRDVLMVRMDEAVARGKQLLILDPNEAERSGHSDTELEYHEMQQRTLEALLGFCQLLSKQYLTSEVYYMLDGRWHGVVIQEAQDVAKLQYIMSDYDFVPQYDLKSIIEEVKKKGDNVLIFTCKADEGLQRFSKQIEEKKSTVRIATPRGGFGDNIWRIDKSYEFVKNGTAVGFDYI